MPTADRTSDGPALSLRLAGRADRVPVAGGSLGFRSRFGSEGSDSALQSLATRLVERAEGFFAAHGTQHLGALGRMWPEERRQRAPWDRGGLYRGEMVLPERVAGLDEVDEDSALAAQSLGRKVFVPHRPVASPWGKSRDAPARVVRGKKTAGTAQSEPRARDVVRVARPVSTARTLKTARSRGQRMIPMRTRALDRAAKRVDEISLLPAAGGRPQLPVSRSDTPASGSARPQQKRPVAAPRGPLARLTRPGRTQALPDRSVSAVQQAASRATRSGRSRGLRPVLGNSPSVEAVVRTQSMRGVESAPVTEGVSEVSTRARDASAKPRTTGARSEAARPRVAATQGSSSPPRPAAVRPSILDVGGSVGAGGASRSSAGERPVLAGETPVLARETPVAADETPALTDTTPAATPQTARAAARLEAPAASEHPHSGGQAGGQVARAAGRLDTSMGSPTASRVSVAAQAVSRAARGPLGERAVSPRRFAVRKMASGVFGPDRVVVAPPAPVSEDVGEAPAAPRRHPGAPPPVVSGFASASTGVASTAAVVTRASRPSAVPAAVLDAQAPSAHAARRLRNTGTASSRSVLPALNPGSARVEAGSKRSAVHRAADRARAGSARADSLVPSPVGAVVGRSEARSLRQAGPGAGASERSARATRRAGVRGAQRRALGSAVDTSGLVAPVARTAGEGASVDGDRSAGGSPGASATQAQVVSSARTAGPAPATVRAADRALGSASALKSVHRVLGVSAAAAPEGAAAAPRSRHARPGPVSYARTGSTPLLRLDAATAEAIGLFSSGSQLGPSGEWLAEGNLATAVQRAASQRGPLATSRGGTPRGSVLRYASPEAETLAGAAFLGAETGGSPDNEAGFAGAPVGSAWGTSPGAVSAVGSKSGRAESPVSGLPAVMARVHVAQGHRPLDFADARSGAQVAARSSSGPRSSGRGPRLRTGSGLPPRPLLGGASSLRTGVARNSRGNAPEAVLPQQGAPETPGAWSAPRGPSGSAVAFQPGIPEEAAVQQPGPGLSGLLQQVGQGAADSHLPVWARRASGRPLIKGTPDGLVSALSRASSEEDVVRVLVEEGREVVTASTLPRPVTEVIKQIRSEATAQVRDAQAQAERDLEESGAPRAAQVAGRQASARVIRKMNTLRGRSRSQDGVGPDQVSRLAKKLQGLIHLAEGVGDRDAARRQVRMAEDSAAARAEGQGGDSTRPDTGLQDQVDIDALSREVLEAVARELELRRERRQEDSDGSFWW